MTLVPETEPESIALSVLSSTAHLGDLNETQQKLALEYLSLQLAIRDREKLIKVFCHSSPDLLTSSIRAMVPAYDPIIRSLHNSVDLSNGVSDFEAFLTDLIRVSTIDARAKDSEHRKPSVEDYCRFLQKHQGSSHRFIHQVLKNSKELSQLYYDYAAHAATQYRQQNPDNDQDANSSAAGDFTQQLSDLISHLSPSDQSKVLDEINHHTKYLSSITAASTRSMHTIIRNLAEGKSETMKGPGIFLSRWQSLMDETPITPATANGPVRKGRSESVKKAAEVDVDGKRKGAASDAGESLEPPDVGNVVRLLGPGFKDLLRDVVEVKKSDSDV